MLDDIEDKMTDLVDSFPNELVPTENDSGDGILDSVTAVEAEDGGGILDSVTAVELGLTVEPGPPPLSTPSREPFPTRVGAADMPAPTHICSECRDVHGGAGATGGSGRAIVGGVDWSVGGWGRYEIDKRKSRWETGGGVTQYGARTYVGAADVVESVTAATAARSPLKSAAEHLSRSLGAMQDVLCEPSGDGIWECMPSGSLLDGPATHATLTVPALTSVDVEEFIQTPDDWANPDVLQSLTEDASIVAAGLGVFADALPPLSRPAFPPLPTRLTPTDDSSAVVRLEASAVPYIQRLEEYQGAVAVRLDAVADAIDKRLRKRKLV